MASKLDIARRSAATARAKARELQVDQMVYAPVAGFAFGVAQKNGVSLPNVAGMGRHATTGLIAAGVAMSTKGTINRAATTVAIAGLTLAGYELGSTGAVVAGGGVTEIGFGE